MAAAEPWETDIVSDIVGARVTTQTARTATKLRGLIANMFTSWFFHPLRVALKNVSRDRVTRRHLMKT